MFPAYAGMIRLIQVFSQRTPSVPRLRGDDAEVTLKRGSTTGSARTPLGIPRLRAEVTLKLAADAHEHMRPGESLGYVPR